MDDSDRSDEEHERKRVPGKVVDAVDAFIVGRICRPIAPFFRATGHTANTITAYGVMFSLAFIWYLWKDDMMRFSFYFWIAYVLDCLDGYYARRYDMVSKFGDIFEHVRDVASIASMFAICTFKYVVSQHVMIIVLATSLITGIHVGCSQKAFLDRDYDESLDVLKTLCFAESFRELFSLYGIGMYMVTLHLVILYLSRGAMFFVKLFLFAIVCLYFIGLHGRRADDHVPEILTVPFERTAVEKEESEDPQKP